MSLRFAALALQPHPTHAAGPSSEPDALLTGIEVSGSLDAAGLLELEYLLRGDLRRLSVPTDADAAAHAGARRDELWRHTCLELFARAGDSPGYLEFNFALNGDWAAYEFAGYRAGQRALEVSQCAVHMRRRGDDGLQVRVSLRVPALASAPHIGSWQLGLAAVVESTHGSLSYWALRHPKAQPDFHDPAGFSCVLNAFAL